MSREAIEVGAFTRSRIQRLYNPDATLHWQRCESEGLQCPQEVFTQLFSEKAHDEDFSVIVRSIDYYSALGLALRVAVGNAGVQRAKARVSRRFASLFATAQSRPTGFPSRVRQRGAVVGPRL